MSLLCQRLGGATLLLAASLLLPPAAGGAERGLLRNAPGAFPGYTLLAPLLSTSTYLVDMEGRVVHRWQSELTPGNSVYLKDNGNLLRCLRVPDNPVFRSGAGGAGGRIRELGWNGEVVWDFLYSDTETLHHHDIEPLPNGNVLLIAWERKSRDEALAAGRDPGSLAGAGLWPEVLVEVEPLPPDGGRVVWEWHVWDHLIQDRDPRLTRAGRAQYGRPREHPELIDINGDLGSGKAAGQDLDAEMEKLRALGYLGGGRGSERRGRRGRWSADWCHVNSVAYNPRRDQILLSVHRFHEVWILDHSTTSEEAAGHRGGRRGKGGDLLFRWGNPRAWGAGGAGDQRLFFQHDATWIADGLPGAGNILVFNNGRGRPGGEFSSVDEIRPAASAGGLYRRETGAALQPAELTWAYDGGPRSRFFSGRFSSAQRLPNGNTLICAGEQGRIFEVRRDGEIVWDYLSPFGDASRGELGHALFRATRLPAGHPGLSRLQ